ncbi:MAG: hypothetical protein NTX00_01235 [Candidatus Parcubacteria bacterium]|nr:hypothetical protein [Candidatus Parcubacteria bacterium]
MIPIFLIKSEGDGERKRFNAEKQAQLVGNLYMIMRRMRANGHNEVADKMQQIIDMVVELDLTDQGAQNKIYDKLDEFDTSRSKFEAELAKLNAQKI